MKRSLPHILAVCVAGSLALLSEKAYAQDDGLPLNSFQEPTHRELNLNEDKPLIYDLGENRPARVVQSPQRETAPAKTKEPKKAGEKSKEDDAYSFNFLYYIIQKYKISDIVDQ